MRSKSTQAFGTLCCTKSAVQYEEQWPKETIRALEAPVCGLFGLNTILMEHCLDYFTERELMVFQVCCMPARRIVQGLAKKYNYLRIASHPLRVVAFRTIPMPEERLDIWTNPTDDRQYLPQSRLQGRCGALLYIDSPSPPSACTLLPTPLLLDASEIPSTPYTAATLSSTTPLESSASPSAHTPPPLALCESPTETQNTHGTPAAKDKRLLIIGGYGLFELWDQNVAIRCNEVWEYNLQEGIWCHPGPMTEDMLEKEKRLRLEERDAVLLKQQEDTHLLVFGQASGKYSCAHIFDSVATLALPKWMGDSHTSVSTTPFSIATQWKPTEFKTFSVMGELPEKRDSFASVLWRAPTESEKGWVLLFGGFTPTLKCLDDLLLLEIPYSPSRDVPNIPSSMLDSTVYLDTSLEEAMAGCYRWRLLGWQSHEPPVPYSQSCTNRWRSCRRRPKLEMDTVEASLSSGHNDPPSPPSLDYGWHSYIQSVKIGGTHKHAMECTPSARFGHSLTKIGDRAYLFGGKCESSKAVKTNHQWFSAMRSNGLMQDTWMLSRDSVSSLQRNNPLAGWKWKELHCTGSLPTPRNCHRTVGIGLTLLLFGGYTGRYMNDMYTLNTGTLVWSFVDISPIAQKGRFDNCAPPQPTTPTKKRKSLDQLVLFDNAHSTPTIASNTLNLPETVHHPSTSLNHPSRIYTNAHNPTSPLIGTPNRTSTSAFNHYSGYHSPAITELHYCLPSNLLSPMPTSPPAAILSTEGRWAEHGCGWQKPLEIQKSPGGTHSTATTQNLSGFTTQSSYSNTPSSSESAPKQKRTKSRDKLESPISKRMEPSMFYNGKDLLYIYGGSKRYRWNGTQAKFSDFCTDCFVLKLAVSIDS